MHTNIYGIYTDIYKYNYFIIISLEQYILVFYAKNKIVFFK